MPIYLADCDKDLKINRITGSDRVKNHLQELGFVVGETIRVLNKVNDNVIVKVKGVTLAISYELAKRILV